MRLATSVLFKPVEPRSILQKNHLITLTPEQLEALALHLDQVANRIRELIVSSQMQPIQVEDVQHIELIFESTDSLLREMDSSDCVNVHADSGRTRREGRPRRTRRRKP